MENPTRFPLMKRLLFPYDGEAPLTVKQSARLVLVWVLFFSLPLTLCALVIKLLERDSLQGTISGIVFAFLTGAFSFGILSLLIVVMSNRAARIRQAWKARNGRS